MMKKWKKQEKHELDGYHLGGMWAPLPRFKAYEDTKWGKDPIKVRWVNSKKTLPDGSVIVRCRLVCCEYNKGRSDMWYAPTPPLETFKLMLSLLSMQKGKDEMKRDIALLIDITKAYANAPTDRQYMLTYHQRKILMEQDVDFCIEL